MKIFGQVRFILDAQEALAGRLEKSGKIVAFVDDRAILLGHPLQPCGCGGACVVPPFSLKLAIENCYVLFFPHGLKAPSISVTSNVTRRIEHQIIAAQGKAGIQNKLLAVPLTHFFPANSLLSTASRYSLFDANSTSPKSSGQSPTRPAESGSFD